MRLIFLFLLFFNFIFLITSQDCYSTIFSDIRLSPGEKSYLRCLPLGIVCDVSYLSCNATIQWGFNTKTYNVSINYGIIDNSNLDCSLESGILCATDYESSSTPVLLTDCDFPDPNLNLFFIYYPFVYLSCDESNDCIEDSFTVTFCIGRQ